MSVDSAATLQSAIPTTALHWRMPDCVDKFNEHIIIANALTDRGLLPLIRLLAIYQNGGINYLPKSGVQ